MKLDDLVVDESTAAEIVEFGETADLTADETRRQVRAALEDAKVVFLRGRGFALTERERQIITDPVVMFRGNEEKCKRNARPTLTFDVASDQLRFSTIRKPERREIEAMLRRYAVWSRDLLSELVPDYALAAEQNRIIYRPVGRDKVQDLHVDTTYLHPTQGRSKLRIFCNIDPLGRPRVWQVGEPFETYVQRYLPLSRGKRSGLELAFERLIGLVGLLEGPRTGFDHLLGEIRQLAKDDRHYQQSAPRRIANFPPGSTWIALTDVVLHGAISGQHALDQVFFLPPSVLSDPSRSALSTLERLSGRQLD